MKKKETKHEKLLRKKAEAAKTKQISKCLVRELLDAPFKYRFQFAMKLIFWEVIKCLNGR